MTSDQAPAKDCLARYMSKQTLQVAAVLLEMGNWEA